MKNNIPFFLLGVGENPILLTPELKGLQWVELFEQYNIQGYYGQDPDKNTVESIKNTLYTHLEKGIGLWIRETLFLPRFLLSSLVFLVLYFVLTYAIRDPVPMIDETIIAGGLSFLFFMTLSKNDQNHNKAIEKKMELKSVIDRIHFESVPLLARCEAGLSSFSHLDELGLQDKILHPTRNFYSEDEADLADILTQYIIKKVGMKRIVKVENEVNKGRFNIKALKLILSEENLGLFILYRALKNTAGS